MSRLKEVYNNEIVDAMVKKFEYKNVMEVPKIEKIVINMGIGEAKENSKILDVAVKELEIIEVRKLFLQRLRIQLLTSSLEKVCQSDVRLHFVVKRCTNF